MKNKPNLIEGRTQEWDPQDWQGKRYSQVFLSQASVFILIYLATCVAGVLLGYFLLELI